MPSRPEFLIYAPAFDPGSGGVIVLHTLCERLNAAGVSAALWPNLRPVRSQLFSLAGARAMAAHLGRGGDRGFGRGPFPSPVADTSDVADAIVVYPETVAGNPLRARNVVRWLLHRPGFHTDAVDFGPDDLFFHYTDAFADPARDSRLLRVTQVSAAYRQTNGSPRRGSCYLVRKGEGPLDRHPPGAVRVDGLDHEAMAAAFNTAEFLYTYDPYTLYTLYAALCGCPSVFLPPPGMTRADWNSGERVPGLAFGEEEKEWARRTRPDLVARLDRDLAEEADMLRDFVVRCRAHFRLPRGARARGP